MADNVGMTETSGGTKIAADEVNDGTEVVKVQRVKLITGGNGTYGGDVTTSNPYPVNDISMGSVADVAYSGTGNGTAIALLKKLVAQFTTGIAFSGNVTLTNSEGVKGQFGGITKNPSASFTRPANSTAYDANDLIANSTTAGSVSYPQLTVARVANGTFQIDRLRLSTTSANVNGLSVRVRLWAAAAPNYGVGDGGAYACSPNASGAAYLGSFVGQWEGFTDKSTAILAPEFAGPLCGELFNSQTNIWWDIQTLDGFTPTSGSSFILTAEVKQD